MPVIGFLSSSGSPVDRARYLTAFRQGLREAGYVEGQNVVIEYRWAQDQADRLPDLAADLVRRQVTVIAAHDTPSSIVAKAATATIPIVYTGGGDPVKLGLLASLNRPGGNVTGVTFVTAELGAKLLGLLHELQPGAVRVGVLVDPNYPTQSFVSDVQAAASSIGKQIEVFEASTGRDIDTVFARLAQKRIDEHHRRISTGLRAHQPDSQREARRPTAHTVDQIRVRDQPQHRHSIRPQLSARAARHC